MTRGDIDAIQKILNEQHTPKYNVIVYDEIGEKEQTLYCCLVYLESLIRY